ncbi:histidine kinase [Campylobacter jejuni]|nr:histidine kinase [Campylobacter jejuni]
MSREIFLQEDSLITSKTDLKGKIVYANFKYLWDYMKEGKEIFAYVKNKTKDNNYYWVFANVTPSIDINNNIIGYYSVRRMPNKSAISTIESLYSDLLRVEQQQGLNKGVEMLENFCKDADKTYNELIFSLQEAK